MLRRFMPGLLFLLALPTLQPAWHAQDCGMNAQSQVTHEGQAAGFDNPAEYDGVVGLPVFGYITGFIIVAVRALIRPFHPSLAFIVLKI